MPCEKKSLTYSLICEVKSLTCDKFSFLGHRAAVNVYKGRNDYVKSSERGKFHTNFEAEV